MLALCFALGFAACKKEPASADPSGDSVVDLTTDAKVIISEVMADNEGFYMSCMDDWAELYNEGEADLLLTGFCLTKNAGGDPLPLDGVSIPAKGYAVIKLDESSAFRLSKNGDTLMLYYKSELMDSMSFTEEIGCNSWTHDGLCAEPTPGFANTHEGYLEYLSSVPVPEVRINEVVSSNSKYAPVNDKYYDFVELYNGSEGDIELSDYFLSDKKSDPEAFRLPQGTLRAGGYYVVYCSGGAEAGHAPFKISSSGETLYLSRGGVVVDCVAVPGDLNRDESYGRNGGAFVYMSSVTPGSANALGRSSMPQQPSANYPSGAYPGEISVELFADGEIHYTTDGSEPTASSPGYTGPITVSGVTTIRAVSIRDGEASRLASFCYIVNAEHTVPVMHVAISQDHLTGERGVLNHVDPEYEHQAFITLMENGEECFSAPCGFKLHGNDSKKGDKQNFQLRFRDVYGMSELKYKVFENRDYDTFGSLLLKGGSEDYRFCGFRDELCTGLADGTTALSVQAYRPVILYLNGQYWGFYWLRERYDDEYCANQLGVSDSSVNMLKDYGEVVVDGSGQGYWDIREYCKTHDLTVQANYDYVMQRIDSLSLMDWYICRSYFGDQDLANVRHYNSEEADGRWHWCFYDLDWAMWRDTEDPIGSTAKNDGYHAIFLALLKNADFKDRFLKRYAYLMNTVLNEYTVNKKIDEFKALMEPEMEKDRQRWGFTMQGWYDNLEKLKDYCRNDKRTKTVLKGLKNYFGLSEEKMMDYFGRTA